MIHHWPLKDLGLTHSIIDAYLEGKESIRDYIAEQPTIEGMNKTAEVKKTHYSKQQRETLVEILQVQLDDLAIPDLDLSEDLYDLI